MDFLNQIVDQFQNGFDASGGNLDAFLNTLPMDPLTGLPNVMSLFGCAPKDDPKQPRGYDSSRWKFEEPTGKQFHITQIIAPNAMYQLSRFEQFNELQVSLSSEIIEYLHE